MAMNENELHELQLQVLQEIKKDLAIISQRDQDCMQLMRDSVKDLRVILIGVDGNNGVRSVVKKHDAELEDLKKWRTQFMAIFAVIQLVGMPIAIYVIQHMIK